MSQAEMLKRGVLAGVVLVLAGCAVPMAQPRYWSKPDGTPDQFNRDALTCRQYGMQSAMANGLAGNLFVESWIQEETQRCLLRLGYSPSASPQPAVSTPPPRQEPVAAGDACPPAYPDCSWGKPK